ncbi:MAG: hypothetical protein IPM51_12570 [Sphingobacteriaceae bacterium]|nr:hypothetical protein [Sphingobacteriaceae bacterium]
MSIRYTPNKLIIIGLVFLLFSCRYTRVPSYLKKEFKYEPHIDTLAQEKIQLAKGFYRELMIDENMPITQGLCFKTYYFDSKDSSLRENTGYCDIMFFENGLCF